MKKLAFFLSFTILFFSCTKNEIEDTKDSRFYGKWSLVEYTLGATYIPPLKYDEGKIIWEFKDDDSFIVTNAPGIKVIPRRNGVFPYTTYSNNTINQFIINDFAFGFKFTSENNLEIFGDMASDGPWYRFVRYSD
ncbi:hypothetical protein [Polaribacter uvawellassae]|uniref:hypothetical protein n=1 Tax=Polaribacter uvawellassae TaxID=3133495 RepID=UPI00321BF1EF